MKIVDFVSLLCLALAVVFGVVLPLVGAKSKRKIWIALAIPFVIASLVPQLITFFEKRDEKKEDLLDKYKAEINDQKILDELRTMALQFDKGVSFVKMSPTAAAYGKKAKIRFIKIASPMGLVALYKVIDPSKYGLQNITPLMPVLFNGKVYYIGATAVPEDRYNKDNRITVISKYKNGLIDIESLLIDDYAFDIKTLSPFTPLLYTNRDRLIMARDAGRRAGLPPVTRFDEYVGIVEFGPFGRPGNAPSGQLRLRTDGGIDAKFVSIPNATVQKFKIILNSKLNQSPSIYSAESTKTSSSQDLR
jgi:hypothetical protein